jgi:hypothetical protein
MTTKEKLKDMLVQNGMFEKQAEKVLDIAIPRIEALPPRERITWDRPAEEYPDVLYKIMWSEVKQAAKEWLAENAPEAWYRPIFDM